MMKKLSIFLAVVAILGAAALGRADQLPPADFTLTSLDGKPVSLHDFAGKTVVLNFWASWCDSCEEEMPQLLRLKEQYAGQDVVFLGINAGDSDRAAQRFVEKMNYSYRILLDHDKSVAKQYQVLGLPQTLIISKDGKIVYRESRPPVKITF